MTMDWSTLRASIDLALTSKSSGIKLMFLGGEPLLEFPLIRAAVKYADCKAPSRKRLKYAISTNGLLITEDVAAFLDEHQFETQLSFDGVAKAQDYRKKGTFATIDRLLDMLQDKYPDLFENRLRICMTQIPATIPYLADSVRYLTNKNAQQIAISPSLMPSPEWKPDDIQELEAQFREIFQFSLRHFRKTDEVPFLLFRKERKDSQQPITERDMCGVMKGKSVVVDVDGQVYGCVLFAESYQKFRSSLLKTCLGPLKMGDLRDPDFWQRRAAFPKAARKAEIFDHKGKKYSSYGRCGKCRYIGRCSVCPVSIGYDTKNTDPHRVPDFICAFNMVALKYRDLFPCMSNPLTRLLGKSG